MIYYLFFIVLLFVCLTSYEWGYRKGERVGLEDKEQEIDYIHTRYAQERRQEWESMPSANGNLEMPFGKYSDCPLKELPDYYKQIICDQRNAWMRGDPTIVKYCELYLKSKAKREDQER